MIKILKKIITAAGYLIAAVIVIELADKGLKAFIKVFDPYYQAVLKGKDDENRMGETVTAVLNKNAKFNGGEKSLI